MCFGTRREYSCRSICTHQVSTSTTRGDGQAGAGLTIPQRDREGEGVGVDLSAGCEPSSSLDKHRNNAL